MSKNKKPVDWVGHNDDNCSVCIDINKRKAGGRPQKVLKGKPTWNGSKSKTVTCTTLHNDDQPVTLYKNVVERVNHLLGVERIPIWRKSDEWNFDFDIDVNNEFYCSICKDVLNAPLETSCQHYFLCQLHIKSD